MAETCEYCGKHVGYNKRDGRIDNAKYLVDHIRDHVQPYGSNHNLFLQIYGDRTLQNTERYRKANKKLQGADEIREEAERIYRETRKENFKRS